MSLAVAFPVPPRVGVPVQRKYKRANWVLVALVDPLLGPLLIRDGYPSGNVTVQVRLGVSLVGIRDFDVVTLNEAVTIRSARCFHRRRAAPKVLEQRCFPILVFDLITLKYSAPFELAIRISQWELVTFLNAEVENTREVYLDALLSSLVANFPLLFNLRFVPNSYAVLVLYCPKAMPFFRDCFQCCRRRVSLGSRVARRTR